MREKRNLEKLKQYFEEYQLSGKLNENTHPWVGESWMRSKQDKIATGAVTSTLASFESQKALFKRHESFVDYVYTLCESVSGLLIKEQIGVLITDEEGQILGIFHEGHRNTQFERFQSGRSLSEEKVGTTSLSIAYWHQSPFILFAAESWQNWLDSGWMGTAPVMSPELLRYGITLFSELNPDHLLVGSSLLDLFKTSAEQFLKLNEQVVIQERMLNEVPFALYRISPESQLLYANRLGKERMRIISPNQEYPILKDIVLNYERTPLAKAAKGVPTYNKEVTWNTQRKNYNDLTSAIPIEKDGEVQDVICVTMPIEDMRSLVAHAAGYSAKYTLESMYGESPVFVAMKEKAEKIAKQKSPVLLLGDSGTGKQRLAHGIHQASERAEGPYVSVKFGDSSLELLEMELFGRGNENGDSYPGKFELADGGTLFLNTLEKMPQSLSMKLLQAIAQGVVYRVGENTPQTIDVRIIAASDIELKKMVDRGEFSADLYHWLSRSVIRVPSLNSRRSDIPLIAQHIISELAMQNRLPEKTLSPSAVEALLSYDWPKNIKQLQWVIEQAFFRSYSPVLEAEDILLPGAEQSHSDWKNDKDAFMDLWNAAGGNVSRLANMLRVSRVTLYRYMKKHGVIKE